MLVGMDEIPIGKKVMFKRMKEITTGKEKIIIWKALGLTNVYYGNRLNG